MGDFSKAGAHVRNVKKASEFLNITFLGIELKDIIVTSKSRDCI